MDEEETEEEAMITLAQIEINQTDLQTYLMCGERYRRRRIENDIIPPGFSMLRGTSVHRGAELNFRQKIDSHEDMKKDVVVDYAVTSLQDTVKAQGVWMNEEQQKVGKATLLNEAEGVVKSLTGLLMDEVVGDHQPELVEHHHKVTLPSGDLLHGRLDLANTEGKVVDIKSRAKKMPTSHYDMSIQLTMYHMLYHLVHKRAPTGVIVEELVNKKVPERVQVKTDRHRSDYAALLNTTTTVLKAIRAGVFPGAYGQMGAWWCSKESCGYWKTCPFVPEHKR
jgi:hypothetical protein